jgi:endothelin-converting enzyme
MWSPVMTDHSRPQSSGTCNTPECVHAASEILFNLSPRRKIIDPCNNIEELVCGGWRDLHDYRPDQGAIFTGTLMAERSQMKMRHILEAGYPKGSEVTVLRICSNCMLLHMHSIQLSLQPVSPASRNRLMSKTSTK